ncbi:MAG: hypothetical protein KGM18_14110 [Sphingomonadales bacterium]|nr:hypothetical protein [Sphingomonadales bacterium]
MVDIFALSVPHVLLLIAVLRLIRRPDLDHEGAEEVSPFGRRGPTPRA